MLKELITIIAFLIILSGIMASFVVNEKSAQKIETQVMEIIQEANENF